jgi:hypothetical protein
LACLVATEDGSKYLPRDAKGQWKTEKALESRKKKNIQTLPDPSVVRAATEQWHSDTAVVIEGLASRQPFA